MSLVRRTSIVALLLPVVLQVSTGRAALAAADEPYDVLVFSRTVGARHDSIPAGIQAIRDLGSANGFTVTATEDASAFTPAGLAPFEAVVFLNTSGDVLDDAQQLAFEGYIRNGGGYAGVHAAADTERTWAFYGDLLGTHAGSQAAVQQANIRVENRAHAATSTLPQTMTRTDEWLNFQRNVRSTARVLSTVDESSYSGGSMGADHPVSWCKTHAGGRAFYTAGGHTQAAYGEAAFRAHLLGGIRYAAGRSKADCRPETGYTTLFNGSTAGWAQAGPGGFTNTDATLHSFDGLGLYWYQMKQFSSYSLKLDWRMAGDDNSGVFIGFPASSDPWSAVNNGYEIQIDATDSPDRTTGSVYGFRSADVAARDAALNPPGEWNTFEILVEGERLRVYLNGALVNDFTNTDPARSLPGHIGIQNHGSGDDVSFRNIRVKELGDAVTVQGEQFAAASGVQAADRAGASFGRSLGSIENGDWAAYSAIDLSGVKTFKARIASGGAGGTVQVRADSPSGAVLGSVAVPVTGGVTTFATVHTALSDVPTGVHAVYLTFSGTGTGLFEIDEFTLSTVVAGPVKGLAGKCMDVAQSGTADGTKIQLYTCNGTDAQMWTRVGQTWRALGKCLDVNNSGTADGTIVHLWTCNGTGAQNWAPAANSAWINPQSGKCLDVRESGTADGTQIQLYTCNGSAAQQWTTVLPPQPTAPPTADFDKVRLDAGLSMGEVMELAVLPDGKVLYINRGTTAGGAQIRLYHNGTGYTGTALQLPVFAGNEDGGLGIALHPQFASNHWVFVHYSPPSPAVNRISRFTYQPGTQTLDPASERVVIQWPVDRDMCCHSAGSLAFDSRANLYFATGDNTSSGGDSAGYAPIDERADRHQQFDAQRTSGNTNDLRGKINRIHPEPDGSYTIPAGNLFAPGTALTRPEIFIMGVRNPFRIWIDKHAGDTLYWGEVGPDANATSAQRGPAAYDEFNRATTAGNYGWPYCGGPDVAYNDWDFAANAARGWFPCGGSTGPVNNSPRNTGLQQLPPTRPALVWEQHGGSREWPQLDSPGGCGAPNHVEVYHYDPGLASDVKWPQYYDNKWLLSEYCRNWIKEVQFDNGNPATGVPTTIHDVLAGMSFLHPMDFEFGPDGALYLLEYGTGYFSGSPETGLYKIIYNAGGNRSPVAKASADRDNGLAPLTVAFSSAGSSDPEGTALTYAWDFDGDGTVDSTAASPSFTYPANGPYTARLTVTDAAGKRGTADLPIVVGNRKATLNIAGVPDGGVFQWGDTVTVSASGSDPEDGAIPCGRITLRVAFGHEEHAHEIGSGSGCGATFFTSGFTEPPDQRVFLIIRAGYTDAGAPGSVPLTADRTIVLRPKHWQGEHFQQANGPAVIVAGSAEGGRRLGGIGNGSSVRYHPVSLKNLTSVKARVSSGGTGGRISWRLDSPTGPEVAFMNVPNTGGWDAYQELTAPVSTPDVETHQLYMVFTNAGAGAEALLDVDWFEFGGPGVGQGPRAGQVVNVASGKCLDINQSGTADGTKIQLHTCNGTGAQRWTIGHDGTLRGLGKCLDVASSGTTNGTLVHLWTCNGTAAQTWTARSDGTLMNPQSSRCLDVVGSGTADGTQVHLWDCHAGANQRWTLP